MAGTATSFDPTLITQNYGWMWGNLAVPGASARITLYTDGSPDATANPSAKHFGHTTDGWDIKAAPSVGQYEVDEAVAPIKRTVTGLEASIAANLAQTADFTNVLQNIIQGFGTYGSGSGYQQIQLGIITLAYMSIALIWPLEADPTKFGVYNLYKAANNSGLANQIKRRAMGNNPVAFTALAITSRAAADQVGNYWKQV